MDPALRSEEKAPQLSFPPHIYYNNLKYSLFLPSFSLDSEAVVPDISALLK